MLRLRRRARPFNWLRLARLRLVLAEAHLRPLHRVRRLGFGPTVGALRLGSGQAETGLYSLARAHRRCLWEGRKSGLRMGLSRFGWMKVLRTGSTNMVHARRW